MSREDFVKSMRKKLKKEKDPKKIVTIKAFIEGFSDADQEDS